MILFISILFIIPTYQLYCSSSCISQLSVCTGLYYNQCTVCSTLFQLYPIQGMCQSLNQIQILAVDLQNSNNLTGFSGNNMLPHNCGPYFLSGNYISGDRISKIYKTEKPHFMIILRFNIIYMGIWQENDLIIISMDQISQSISYQFCSSPENICTSVSQGIDCIKIKQVNASHNSTQLSIEFASSIISKLPIIQSWGLKDLMVVLKTCHPWCVSCYGSLNSHCLICSPGFFLIGNVCQQNCPFYVIKDLGICVKQCPDNYYVDKILKICQICSQGCSLCRGPQKSDCILFQSNKKSLWQNQRGFLVFLILLGGFLLFIGICLLLRLKYKFKLESVVQTKQNISNQNNLRYQSTNMSNSIYPIGKSDILQTQILSQQNGNIYNGKNKADSDVQSHKIKLSRVLYENN